jgi:hypothetical protein
MSNWKDALNREYKSNERKERKRSRTKEGFEAGGRVQVVEPLPS